MASNQKPPWRRSLGRSAIVWAPPPVTCYSHPRTIKEHERALPPVPSYAAIRFPFDPLGNHLDLGQSRPGRKEPAMRRRRETETPVTKKTEERTLEYLKALGPWALAATALIRTVLGK